LTPDQPFLQTYSRLMIDIAHRRGILALGGTGSTVPTHIDSDADLTTRARVRQEKLAEVMMGFDGTWVAHPALVDVARSVFDEHMPQPNQIYRTFRDHAFGARDLLQTTTPPEVSEEGVRSNVRAALRYLASWLAGIGTVVIDGRLEHLGTAEIARAQLWQWLRHGVELEDGRRFTASLFDHMLIEQFETALQEGVFEEQSLRDAKRLLSDVVKADDFAAFIPNMALKELP
jgi:malate synthase